jgi:hypothetical protein
VNRIPSKISVLALVCVLASTVTFAQSGSFYSNLLSRGVSDALAGNTNNALTELRLAAFGLLDSLPEYETAQVYLAVLNDRAGLKDEARNSLSKFLAAEKIGHAYATLPIDATIRQSFEALRGQYADALAATRPSRPTPEPVSPELLPQAQPPARPAPQTPPAPAPADPTPPRPRPAPTTPPPAASSAPATAQPQRAAVDATPANLQSAQDRLRAGDDEGARRYAQQVLAADPRNLGAQSVLATVAFHTRQWSDAISRFSDLRTRRKLTDDENAMLFVAYVNSRRFADARAAMQLLKPASLNVPSVRDAMRLLDSQEPPPPPPPASRPAAAASTAQAAPARPATPSPATTTPAAQPATPQRPVVPPQPANNAPKQAAVSPLVAASRHSPSVRTTSVASDVTQAQQLLNEGKIIAARDLFISLSDLTGLPRSTTLAIARGLSQASAFHESSVQYYKIQPFQKGEELHMFTEAVNRYELGDLKTARELLARAVPALQLTREMAVYKSKIEAAR